MMFVPSHVGIETSITAQTCRHVTSDSRPAGNPPRKTNICMSAAYTSSCTEERQIDRQTHIGVPARGGAETSLPEKYLVSARKKLLIYNLTKYNELKLYRPALIVDRTK